MSAHLPFIPTQLLVAHFTVSDKKTTIINKINIILTNERRPYKSELQKLQLKLDKIDMS